MRSLTDSQWERYFTLVDDLAGWSQAARERALRVLRAQGRDHRDVLSLVALHFALPPEPDRCRRGERIGRFTLGDPIASGGMGVVYRAIQDIGREVALKVIHPALMAMDRDDALSRFADEITTLAKLEHANIARIYDGGMHHDPATGETLPYFAMQLVHDGVPITVYATAHDLTERERLELFVQICDAVHYAHTHAVVHRDLKPANLLVDAEGHCFVIDFGLAQACDLARSPTRRASASGTPAYMSPEQLTHDLGPVGPASDLYTLGIILYELLTGQRPRAVPCVASPDSSPRGVMDVCFPPLGECEVADRGTLETIVAKALDEQPAARFPSVAAFRDALRHYLNATANTLPIAPAVGPFYFADNRLIAYMARGVNGQARLRLETQTPELAAARVHFAIGDETNAVILYPEPRRPGVWSATCECLQSFATAVACPPQCTVELPQPTWRVVTALLVSRLPPDSTDPTHTGDAELEQLNRFHHMLRETVQRYGAQVLPGIMGEDAMAFFGVPQMDENDAERAILAALDLRQTFASVRERATLGVATGRVYVDPRHEGVHATELVHHLRHIQQASSHGTICVAERTYRRTRHTFQFRLRQIPPARRPVYEVVAPMPSHPHPTMIGRQYELARLRECVMRLRAGIGQFVAIEGEAGIGKSRLLTELRHQVGHGVRWLESHALSYTHTLSYGHFREVLRRYADITVEDDERRAEAKLTAKLAVLLPEQSADTLPYLLQLAGVRLGAPLVDRVKYLTPEGLGRQMFHAAFRFFSCLAREGPLVLLLENWHRRDPASAGLLTHLLPLIHQFPLLICVVSRPARPSAAHWQQLAAGRYHHLVLPPLATAECDRLLDRLTSYQTLAIDVRTAILYRAQGNPFYLEEMAFAYASDAAVAAAPIPTPPDTIEAQILARFDQLPERLKDVLRAAAVIGRCFAFQIVQTVTQVRPDELACDLVDLQHLQFIESDVPVERVYRFKHDLVQEALCQHIVWPYRQTLHRQVGEALETVYADQLHVYTSHLAYHYAQAEVWDKAKDYLLQAGDLAAQVAADAEALRLYQQVIALCGDQLDTPQWMRLQRKMGEALYQLGEHQKSEALLLQALTHVGHPHPTSTWCMGWALVKQLARHLGRQVLPWRSMPEPPHDDIACVEECLRIYELLVWMAYATRRTWGFLQLSLTALNLAERNRCTAEAARCFAGIGATCDFMTGFRLAAYYHRRAIALAEQVQHPRSLGLSYFCFAIHNEFLGSRPCAIAYYRRAADLYWDIGELRDWGTAVICLSRIYTQQGDFARSLKESEKLMHVGQEGADPLVWGWGLMRQGDNLMRLGDLDEAVHHLQRATALLRSVPEYHTLAEADGLLAQCHLRQGDLCQALAVATAREQLVCQNGLKGRHKHLVEIYLAAAEQASGAQRKVALTKAQRACRAAQKGSAFHLGGVPRAWRLRGTLAWFRGKPTVARKWWQRSLHSAERLGARWELGMTYLEMGERLQEPAHLKRAEAILTDILAAFDAGRARALLPLMHRNDA